MKSFVISILIIFIMYQTGVLTAQSIEWTRVYHDDYGRPLYTGGTSYSAPAFADIDGDGDQDYFQGCENGTIWFFENVGTPDSAVWHFVTEKYNNIEFDYLDYSNVTFADIDADGDFDMFVGGKSPNDNKGIHFYENVGDSTNPSWLYISDRYMNINYHNNSGLYYYCHGQFLDFDNDSDLDLFFINSGLWITYYANIGSDTSAIFSLVTDNLLNEGLSGGYPNLLKMIDIDNDIDIDIFLGSGFWRNVGTPDSASWQLESYNYYDLDYPIGLDLTDIDNDLDYDGFVGMYNGKVYHFENITTVNEPDWELKSDNPFTIDFDYYSSPSFCDIDGDSLPEMFIVNGYQSVGMEPYSSVFYYENLGTPDKPLWELDTISYFNIKYPDMSAPVFADIDNDGDKDIILAYYNAEIIFHENTGDKFNPQFDSTGVPVLNFDPQGNAYFHLALVDIDADNDLDMYISSNDALSGFPSILLHYRNEGTPEIPIWTYINNFGYPFGTVSFMDEDSDGDYDMFIGGWGDIWFSHDIYLYENVGNDTSPSFQYITDNYACIHVGEWQSITFYDIDYDTDIDLIIGEMDGGINLFKNDGLVGIEQKHSFKELPDKTVLLNSYPNPFNSHTRINFHLNNHSKTNIAIYNNLGELVKVLINKRLLSGSYSLPWNGTNIIGKYVSSGIYFVLLKTPNYSTQIKLLYIK